MRVRFHAVLRTGFSVVLLLMSLPMIQAMEPRAVLHWVSGDSLPGRLLHVTTDEVKWESSLFADPLQLQRSFLSSVQFQPAEAAATSADQFRVALKTTDVLFGNLKSLDEDVLTLVSTRHGVVQIPRNLIGGIERVSQNGLIYLGPTGFEGWSGSGVNRKWKEEPDGSLTTSTAEAVLSRVLRDEQKLAVELILEFGQRPDFVMSLGRGEAESLRLETWYDELVVSKGLEFLEIQSLTDETTSIHLLLYVDLTSDRVLVCSPAGEVLAQSDQVRLKRRPQEISFTNGSGQMLLRHLRVERWNGTAVGSLIPGRTGLQQVDGQVRYGQVSSIADGQVTLKSEEGDVTVPVQEIGSLEVATDDALPREKDDSVPARMKWRDGGLMQGQIIQMTEEAAMVVPSWSSQPIAANPRGLQTIEFIEGANTEAGPDELIVGGRLLHGHLVVDKGEKPVTWRPTGATTGVSLRSGDNAVVTRSKKATNVVVDAEMYPDTLYLRNNDIIPCRLDRIEDKFVRLSSPFATAREFPSTGIKALELSSTRQRNSLGFAEDEWKRIRGRIQKTEDSVALKSGSFGHENGMSGDRLRFTATWPSQQWTFMTVHLFADNLRRPTTSSTCTLMFSENYVVATEKFERQNPFGAIQNPNSRVQTNGTTAEIQLVTSRGKVEVVINGKSVKRFPLNRDGVGNRGVLFELSQSGNGQLFGGGRRVRVRGGLAQIGGGAPVAQEQQQAVKYLTLSNLETGLPTGASIQKFIDEESRQHALTIPRFRRDDPATHALIARNGDVLRGRLIGIHADYVEFESRLEAFRFPRERVATVIWIQNPPAKKGTKQPEQEEPAPAADASVLQTVLSGGFLVSMTPSGLSDGLLQGNSAVLGQCSVPAGSISRLYLGDPKQRDETAAYSQWKARHALEPDWDIASSNGGSSAGAELVGQPAPDFELPQLDGKSFRLSDHAGKIVVLDFWATWCGPCVAALPDYVNATRFFDESKLVFVAVNIEESPQQIRAFLKEHELDVRVAIDGGSDVASQYQVTGIPHSLIVGPDGTIEYVHVGYDPDAGAEIQRIAEEILAGTWSRETTSDNDRATPDE